MTTNFKWHGDRAKKQIFSVVEKGLKDMGADSVKQAIANFHPPDSESHPRRITSTLVRAIIFDLIKEKGEVIVKVGIMKGSDKMDEALEYAEPLELGTDRHPPYPYLLPAVFQITRKAKDYF